jgi:hypothetical protein
MDDVELRKRAVERVRLKREFLTHLLLYLGTNAMLVLVWAVTGHGYPWFVWPLVGWGIGMLAHAITLMMKLRELGPEDQAVEREIRRMRQRVP